MSATPDNDEPGAFRCPTCRCQISRSPTDPALEYGHARGRNSHVVADGGDGRGTGPRCPRRDDRCDPQNPGAKTMRARYAAGELEVPGA